MYEGESIFINNGTASSTSAYFNEYKNSNPIRTGSKDYRDYMTKSLLSRGFLFYNSKRIEELYKEKVDSLYTEEFKKLFLYDPTRSLKNVYTDADSLVNMNVTGYYDFMSAMLTPNTAKFFKLIEPFTADDYNVLDLVTGDDDDAKKLALADKLDARVMTSIKQCVENIRIILTYPLYEPIKATSADKNNVTFRNMQIIYNSIDQVYTLLGLYFSVKDLIGDISPIYQSYIKILDNLKNVESMADMFNITDYFSKKVLTKYISDETRQKYNYVIVHPMFDDESSDKISRSVPEVIVSFCENAMNLRYMIKELASDDASFDTLFALVLSYTNIYVQSFYIRSYITMNEKGGQRKIKDMFRYMNPVHESVVPKATTYEYIKEVIENGD